MWERKIVKNSTIQHDLYHFFKTTQLKLLYIAHGIAHENRCGKLARLIKDKSKISLPGDREKGCREEG